MPEAIARVLQEAGIHLVFGMPGGRTGALFNALAGHREAIRAVLVREEGLATVMADVYGRLTGRPGVAIGQGAFLLTNAGMGIVESYLAGSPVVLLSDLSDGAPFSHHGPYQAGTGEFGTWDARETIGGYTKQVFVGQEGAQAVQQTQLAIKHALAGQPGPVAVLYHSAALEQTVGPETSPRLYATSAYLRPGGSRLERRAHRGRGRAAERRRATGHHRGQWCADESGAASAARAGRSQRGAGGHDGGGQRRLPGSACAGPGGLRNLRARCGKCRRGRR